MVHKPIYAESNHFDELSFGIKNFVIMEDRHNFNIGDTVVITKIESGKITEKELTFEITHCLRHAKPVKKGYVILSLK